jgi:hypothetical protein
MLGIAAFVIYDIVRALPPTQLKLRKESQNFGIQKFPKIYHDS